MKRFSRTGLCFNLHPTRQPEYDPVLTVHGHAFHQPGPQDLIELGDELRQDLHALDEPLDLHDLIDLLHDGIAFVLGLFIPADKCIVSLVVFLLVLRHPGVPGDQVVHRLGVDAKLLVQNPAFLLQRRGITEPVLYGGELRNVEFPVRIELIYHSDKRGLDLILGQMRRLAAGPVFEFVVALPDHAAVLVVAVPDLRAVPSAAATAADLSGEYGHPTVYWKKSLDSASSIYYN